MNGVLRIGLTGGIGSGKTAVSDMFRSLGVPVFDADVIAREIVEPGTPAYNQVIDLFGEKVVSDDGSLKRDLIRDIVFRDAELKRRLEEIIHPRVQKEMENRVKSCDYPYCILSIPLLFETNADDRVDRVLVIDAEEQLQLDRILKRDNLSVEQAHAIMSSQADRHSRLKAADDIIDNNGSPEATRKQVEEMHEKYLELSSQTRA